MNKLVFLTVSLFSTSCVTFEGVTFEATVTQSVRQERVTNRAKWDLDCKNEPIAVQKIDDVNYSASGCGKEALYLLDKCHPMNWASVCTAILSSEVRPVKK
jgi:hypothetical protein